MKNAIALAPRLAAARLRGANGGAILDVFAVVAFTVATWLALTVAGGTWMFFNWAQNGNPQMVANLGGVADPDISSILASYVALAGFAFLLMVVPILSLGGAAARLGARGRSTRLASLRLIGMTGSEVVAISVIETMVQAAVGMVLGTVLWLVSLPAWGLVSFQTVRLTPSLMTGPWWLWIAVWGVVMVLAVLSTIIGLRRVRISPLGVATRQTPPALRSWRFILFVIAAVAAGCFVAFGPSNVKGAATLVLIVGGFVGVLMLVINLVGPWLIQLFARMRARTSSLPMLLASRRISDDPKTAWRNVSALALTGFVGAFIIMVPLKGSVTSDMDLMSRTLLQDMRTGAIITLVISMVVGAVSTLISQSSAVIDRAEESRSLDRMGMERNIFAKMRRRQVLLPLIVTLAISVGLGLLMATPFMSMAHSSSPAMLAAVMLLGIALSLLAAEACSPVQNAVLNQTKRRND